MKKKTRKYAATGTKLKKVVNRSNRPKRKPAKLMQKAKVKPNADITKYLSKAKQTDINIFNNGCLVHFSMGNWGATMRLEKREFLADAPKEVIDGFKYLVDQGPRREIASVGQRVWTFLNMVTAPYKRVKGVRYADKHFIDFISDNVAKLEKGYWKRVDQFVDEEFELLRDRMLRQHPKFFKSRYYPSKQQLRDKYHWDLEFIIVTIPDKELFSQDQYKKQLKKEQARAKEFFNDAVLVVSAKFLELTTHLRNKLVNKEAFKTATVENLQEFIELFPKLNVTGDKSLAKLVKQCKGYLKNVDADVLKDNQSFANQVGKQMDSVLKEFGKIHDGELLRCIDI